MGKRKLGNPENESTIDDEKEDDNAPSSQVNNYDQAEVDKILSAKNHSVQPVKQQKKNKRKKVITEDQEEEEEEVVDSESLHPSIKYLLQWNNNKAEWKFKTVRQVWLLQNAYRKDEISKDHFKILLAYMADLKGKSRESTIQAAQEIVESDSESDKTKIKRATKVLRLLS